MTLQTGLLRSKSVALATTALCCGILGGPAANAVELPLGSDWSGAFDTTLSMGVGMRTSSTDCRFLSQDVGGCASTGPTPIARSNSQFSQSYDNARINQDYGDRNFDRGELYSMRLGGVSELYLKNRPTDLSALTRVAYQYDFKAGNHATFGEQTGEAMDFATREVRLLDAYVNKEASVAGHDIRVRVGNQVLSWGENVFIAGGINSINAYDIRKLHQPGVQLKEVTLPAPMLDVTASVTENVSLEGYYQAMWNSYEFDAPGTFFATNNYLGRGRGPLYIASSALGQSPGTFHNGDSNQTNVVIPHGNDAKASNQGQFGFALRQHGETTGNELGLFYYRYHDKIPSIGYTVDTATARNAVNLGNYNLEYGEYRSLYGLSYNMRLGEWMLGMEGSYRPRDSVAIDPTIVNTSANSYACITGRSAGYHCRGYVETDKWQFHLTGNHIMSPSGSFGWLMKALGADEGTILAEGVYATTPNLDLGGSVPYAVTSDYRLPTRNSAGVVGQVSVTYSNAFDTRVALIPELTVSQGVAGISATPTPGFVEGVGAVNLGLTVDLKTELSSKIRADFTHNYGGGTANPLLDRDAVQMTYTMSF